jgi:Holliday junction resolvase RusA-like endonuclease
VSTREIDIKFAVEGTPVSLKARNPSRHNWQEKVRAAALRVLPDDWELCDTELSMTIYDFPTDLPQGDVDNIIKRIQDALNEVVYVDDKLIRRVVAHRFLPEEYEDSTDLPDLISEAILNDPPFVFLAIKSDPFSEAV